MGEGEALNFFKSHIYLLGFFVFLPYSVQSSSCVDSSRKKQDLSPAEKQSIKIYTEGAHERINLFLSHREDANEPISSEELTDEEVTKLITQLESALKKLPEESGTFYRSVHIHSSVLAEISDPKKIKDITLADIYKPGSVVKEKSFLSMSDLEHAPSPYGYPTHIFKVTTQKGK